MPGLALLGVEQEEEGLDEVELWPSAEEGNSEDTEGEEGGPGPPSAVFNEFPLFFPTLLLSLFLSFPLFRELIRVGGGDTPL